MKNITKISLVLLLALSNTPAKSNVGRWLKDHKKEIGIGLGVAAGTAAAAGTAYGAYKYKDKLIPTLKQKMSSEQMKHRAKQAGAAFRESPGAWADVAREKWYKGVAKEGKRLIQEAKIRDNLGKPATIEVGFGNKRQTKSARDVGQAKLNLAAQELANINARQAERRARVQAGQIRPFKLYKLGFGNK